jgi:hypothetical protein
MTRLYPLKNYLSTASSCGLFYHFLQRYVNDFAIIAIYPLKIAASQNWGLSIPSSKQSTEQDLSI